jgi:type I restriction enzyme R subunit
VGKFTEDQLVEQPAIALFAEMGWSTVNAMAETFGPEGNLGRDNQSEVVLTRPLRAAMERLNSNLPPEAISKAVEEISKDRSALDHVRANREIHGLLRDGVRVQVRADDGSESPEVVRVVNWDPEDVSAPNEFLLVSQLWIHSDLYRRRADLVGFVNGIPLVFVELKASHKNLRHAYDDNLTDYRATIPRVFQPNGFIILSNGVESKVGTVSSGWEHFAEWKKINSEGEVGVVSLETILRGTCAPARLLDLVENFVAFSERPGGLVKLVAKNHQYLGVNNAIDRLAELAEAPAEERGRLGVFWHTQGSGKTMSMLFFSQKVLRKRAGNWTFVIVTDRAALDDQAYGEFTDAGVLTEGHVQATSGEHLKQLLGEDHRYVFSLIQKFRIDRGETYPVVSDRSDIIVITDEAHRSQYDVLALNMRNALPNASFLGFTGTPLIAGEERTREVFGDYVSRYDFGASIIDGATVPLFYENRIPELQLANENFDDDLAEILEDAELDEAQEAKVARLFSQQYALITREDRLDRVAADLVEHFLGRGFAGKAMVVSIDKATAVRMYDKVQAHWTARLVADTASLADPTLDQWQRDQIEAENAFMSGTDMAVVVSQSQNEIGDMAAKGLDILPHRTRMVSEDLETKFKDPADPLRIVFVCAMWTTGFDVPSCSTIYLDKPMKNHSLMQTIARANRVFPEKNNGLIVDYIGVFRNLEAALAIYAGTGDGNGASPVKDKAELVAWLHTAIANATDYCTKLGINLDSLLAATGLDLVAQGQDAVERILVDDTTKAQFLTHARLVDRLFKAMLPDPDANQFGPVRAVLVYLAEAIASLNPPVDVSHVMARVEQLLDESVAANAYVIHGAAGEALAGEPIDLNQIDWDALAAKMAKGKQRTEAEKLRAAVAAKVNALARLNPTRIDWLERFQKLIDEYNAGSHNVEEFFKRLVEFTKDLNEEERRGVAEHLTEEQLAVYDLLMRPAPDLTDAEIAQVKKVAESLLELLRREKIVLDWRKEQQSRAAVRLAVETKLDELPDKFDTALYREKCDAVYLHIFDSYWDDGHSIYDRIRIGS